MKRDRQKSENNTLASEKKRQSSNFGHEPYNSLLEQATWYRGWSVIWWMLGGKKLDAKLVTDSILRPNFPCEPEQVLSVGCFPESNLSKNLRPPTTDQSPPLYHPPGNISLPSLPSGVQVDLARILPDP